MIFLSKKQNLKRWKKRRALLIDAAVPLKLSLDMYQEKNWYKERENVDIQRNFFTKYFKFKEVGTAECCIGVSKKEPHVMYVMFRGSDEFYDWFVNFNFCKESLSDKDVVKKVPLLKGNNLKMHGGFLSDYLLIDKWLKTQVSKLKPTTIKFMGHSKGAATAVVAFVFAFLRWGHAIKLSLYPFCGPKVLSKKAKNYIECFFQGKEKLYYYVHGADVVPRLPPFFFGFRHLGQKVHVGKYKPYKILSFLFGRLADHYPDTMLEDIKKEIKKLDNKIKKVETFVAR